MIDGAESDGPAMRRYHGSVWSTLARGWCVAGTHFEYRYWRFNPGLAALESHSIYPCLALLACREGIMLVGLFQSLWSSLIYARIIYARSCAHVIYINYVIPSEKHLRPPSNFHLPQLSSTPELPAPRLRAIYSPNHTNSLHTHQSLLRSWLRVWPTTNADSTGLGAGERGVLEVSISVSMIFWWMRVN